MKVSTIALMTGDYLTSINYFIYENFICQKEVVIRSWTF